SGVRNTRHRGVKCGARRIRCRTCGGNLRIMPQLRTGEAGRLLGVSDDTVRRWVDSGKLPASRDEVGRVVIEGRDLARFAQQIATAPDVGSPTVESARNRFTGLVTRVVKDT